MGERRGKIHIYYDILKTIRNSTAQIKVTHIQIGAKLSYDKTVIHLQSMKRFGLIDNDLHITLKGKNYSTEVEKINIQLKGIQEMLGLKSDSELALYENEPFIEMLEDLQQSIHVIDLKIDQFKKFKYD